MRHFFELVLVLSTLSGVKVTETVVVYADATTPDAGHEATGVGDQADNSAINSGAVYVRRIAP